MRLLIVEDEKDILRALQKGLEKEGYAVDIADNGESASELIEYNPYDLIVLDINLPKVDGFTLLRKLREQENEAKVIVVTAKGEVDDRILGLDLGANDYLVKPFDFGELKARIRALLRTSFGNTSSVIQEGRFELNLATHKVTYDGKEIVLTRKEYMIFSYLVRNKGKIVSAEELYEHVWNEDADPFSQVIRVHVYSLRKKMSQVVENTNVIETIKGVGYLYEGGK